MSKLTKALTAAAGNAGGDPLYVEDVFSTYLYEGDGQSNRDIVNGIDLSNNGGLVWLKTRSTSYNHFLNSPSDITGYAQLPSTGAWTTSSNLVTFNDDGFRIPIAYSGANASNSTSSMASWTFRKAEKFFDVVTYSSDTTSGARTISHNLGSTPAFIIVKGINFSDAWYVYHISTGVNKYLELNLTGAGHAYTNFWGVTDSTFTVDSFLNNNGLTGKDYVAYLFASDAGGFGDDGSESIIKCGSYTGNGAVGNEINLGFEPQWLMFKRTDSTSDWSMFDVMRGIATGGNDARLRAQGSDAENEFNYVDVTSTGFSLSYAGSDMNASGGNYIYIAIRRPMKTPESGTEVFESIAYTGNNSTRELNTTILADAVRIGGRSTSGWATGLQSRLTGKEKLFTASTGGAAGDSWGKINAWDYQDAIEFTAGSSGIQDVNGSGITYIAHAFKRATGFFDVVAYSGDGVAGSTQAHNLGVAPECMIVKRRDGASSWITYWDALGATKGQFLDTNQAFTSSSYWNDTAPTATQLTLGSGSTNNSGATFIAYLFATLAGVSKVGSYTGTGNSLDIDCGFANGARFVMIKRTDSSSDWWVWDTARGIVAGNDPTLRLNSTASETTTADYIDPLSSGFTLTTAGNWLYGMNYPTGNYIFLAIA